jgi:hypothetical protein
MERRVGSDSGPERQAERPRVVFNLRERRPGNAYGSPGTPVLALGGVSGPDGHTPPLNATTRDVVGLRLPGSPAVDPRSLAHPTNPAPFPGVEPFRLNQPSLLAAEHSPWYGQVEAGPLGEYGVSAGGASPGPSHVGSPGGESTASATAGLIEAKLQEARQRMDEVRGGYGCVWSFAFTHHRFPHGGG